MYSDNYNDLDYKKAYNSLNEAQKYVLDNMIKEGYKTKWLHVFAIKKGFITKGTDVDEFTTEGLSIEWDFVDYTDYFKINPSVRCSFCNHALRHAYKIKNLVTQEISILGIDHFQQFTGLSASDVKNIVKEFKRIDIEKKEILSKVIEKRDIVAKEKLHKEFIIPIDMINQIEVNLPLLDRQIERLRRDYKIFTNKYKSKIAHNKKISNYKNIESKNNSEVEKKFEIYHKAKNNIKMLNYKNEVNNKENFISFDELKYENLIADLNNRNCTQSQVEMLFHFLKSNKNRLEKYNIDKNELQKAVNKQLGNLKNSELRKLLIEIECLFGW